MSLPNVHTLIRKLRTASPAVTALGALAIVAVATSLVWLLSIQRNVFTQSITGLPEAKESERVLLKTGDTYELEAGYVSKQIGTHHVRMIGYNGSVPGPFITVPQGGTVTVHFKNNLDINTTVHSHGLRLDFPNDGTPGMSQAPIPPGGTFTYTLKFPDGGVYWYHPHVREDYGQELGMYGNYIVTPTTYSLPPVTKEIPLVVDDILFKGDTLEPFYKDKTNFAIMGRFGNVMLVNGKTDYAETFKKGDVVRFDITNVANARPFELHIPGAQIKLVGSELSPYEHETFIDKLIILPAERYIVDVYFPNEGTFEMTNESHDRTLGPMTYTLATFNVQGTTDTPHVATFKTLHTYQHVVADAKKFAPYQFKSPNKKLNFEMDPGKVDFGNWMQNLPCHRMPNGEWMGACTEESKNAWLNGVAQKDMASFYEKIHWEDHMFVMNRATTTDDITWQLKDPDTGLINEKINDWKFRTGDVIKLRLYNDPVSAHPMQHDFHMHGERMMVIATNGEPVTNHVWKDTILVQTGDTVDVIVEFSNPGLWMAHCHIAEHLSAGMMLNFAVGESYFDMYDNLTMHGHTMNHGSH